MAEVAERLRAALAGRYRVERELGRGGMATVYLAHDLKHGRDVAVKVMHPEITTSLGAERFLREIRTAAQLVHPHILALYDSGEADGLLYYTMPYVSGESLADRIAREGPLPIDDAVRIAREVADALAYAHSQGIVHRDIKPGNILLPGPLHACVADFGLVRAIDGSVSQQLTATGISVGSPLYMAPEQIGGGEVDGRADVYSLGCVLFEMLTGRPPFDGRTAQEVWKKHLVEPPPSIHSLRDGVPRALECVVGRALEKSPDQRADGAGALRLELEGEGSRTGIARWASLAVRLMAWSRSVTTVSALLVLLVGAIVSLRLLGSYPGAGARDALPDSLRYVILPFAGGGIGRGMDAELLLYGALSRWDGITLVEPMRAEAAVPPGEVDALSVESARRIAAGLGAGRFVLGRKVSNGNETRIFASVYDSQIGARRLGDASLRYGVGDSALDARFLGFGEELLFGSRPHTFSDETTPGTRSALARWAYLEAQRALEDWDLDKADSLFARAAREDPAYARAHLWLAQTRNWAGISPVLLTGLAQRALRGIADLSRREMVLARALLAMAEGRFDEACAAYDSLTGDAGATFAAAFGRGECRARDDAVIRDQDSPSGFRFRSSYERAAAGYLEALYLLPAIHPRLQGDGFARVRGMLFTDTNRMRPGRALPPDTGEFVAYAGLESDTLSFVPYPISAVMAAEPRTLPPTAFDAVLRQRKSFNELARSWVQAYPNSVAALEAMVASMEMLGDRGSIEVARTARTLAPTREQRTRLAATEAWLRVKFSIPDDLEALNEAWELADSVLNADEPQSRAANEDLATLAALLGRANEAARLAAAAPSERDLPAALAAPSRALLVFSAMGGPADSISGLESRIENALVNTVVPSERAGMRYRLLGQAAPLAQPVRPFKQLTSMDASSDYLLGAVTLLERGDTGAVRNILRRIRDFRMRRRAADLSFDALLVEARLLTELGAPEEAIRWIDPTLADLRWIQLATLPNIPRAAAFVRTLALRAELAADVGDRSDAVKWARAVALLWKDCDPEFSPVVQKMDFLSSQLDSDD